MRLLLLELAERPEHPFTLFNLGMTQLHLNRPADAADYLRRSLAVSPPHHSHVKKAFALLALAEMQQKRPEEALAACRQGLKFQPHDVELRFREAGTLQELGRLAEARDAYMALLDDGASGAFQFSSINLGMRGSGGGVSAVTAVSAELWPDFFQPELRPCRWQTADGGEGRVRASGPPAAQRPGAQKRAGAARAHGCGRSGLVEAPVWCAPCRARHLSKRVERAHLKCKCSTPNRQLIPYGD